MENEDDFKYMGQETDVIVKWKKVMFNFGVALHFIFYDRSVVLSQNDVTQRVSWNRSLWVISEVYYASRMITKNEMKMITCWEVLIQRILWVFWKG